MVFRGMFGMPDRIPTSLYGVMEGFCDSTPEQEEAGKVGR